MKYELGLYELIINDKPKTIYVYDDNRSLSFLYDMQYFDKMEKLIFKNETTVHILYEDNICKIIFNNDSIPIYNIIFNILNDLEIDIIENNKDYINITKKDLDKLLIYYKISEEVPIQMVKRL